MLENISNIPDGYSVNADGLWLKPANYGKRNLDLKKISDPIWVSAETRHPHSLREGGMMVHWIDRNLQQKKEDISYSRIFTPGLGLAKYLSMSSRGLAIVCGREKDLCTYLRGCTTSRRIFYVEGSNPYKKP